jgi:ABC-type transport system involved in multi-copper enzyme maturation permease subunit
MARLDLAVWRRSPWAIAAALIPPLGMLFLVKVLTIAVAAQPIALVVEDLKPQSSLFAEFIRDDTESYILHTSPSLKHASDELAQQRVVAVIDIPKGFDEAMARGRAEVPYTLNNVDIDISDDIRRSIDTSVAEFDAPQLGSSVPASPGHPAVIVPNPYRVDIAETDLRHTDTPFDTYQVLPVLLLLVLTLGVLGGALLGSRDHERRTMTFLRQTPLSRSAFVAGRLLGTLSAMAVFVVPVTVYLTWNGTLNPPKGHWPAFLGILAMTAVLAASLGVLLGSVLRRAAIVSLAGVTVATYLFFLGGGFTTIAFLPEWLRNLSKAIPTRYAIDGMRQSLFYPTYTGFRTDVLVLASFAAAALVAAIVSLGRSVR